MSSQLKPGLSSNALPSAQEIAELKDKKAHIFFKSLQVAPDREELRLEPMDYIVKRVQEGSRLHGTSTDGVTSSGFTSTCVGPITQNKLRQLSDDEIRKDYYQSIKSKQIKGQVQVITNFGNFIVEVHCDKVPKTGENFIELCEQKYFNKVKFHRLIKGFMVSLTLYMIGF